MGEGGGGGGGGETNERNPSPAAPVSHHDAGPRLHDAPGHGAVQVEGLAVHGADYHRAPLEGRGGQRHQPPGAALQRAQRGLWNCGRGRLCHHAAGRLRPLEVLPQGVQHLLVRDAHEVVARALHLVWSRYPGRGDAPPRLLRQEVQERLLLRLPLLQRRRGRPLPPGPQAERQVAPARRLPEPVGAAVRVDQELEGVGVRG
mmetsp:Transcript_103078/g.269107  ORF Transcript_103078/g.269107 Transcript_103078/m.269107 type:complete len:202 (-) Transcript_103078:174-779(-)